MLRQWLADLRVGASSRQAVAGNGAGVVDVSGRPNYAYARLGASDGEVIEVRTSTIHPNDGDFILIVRDNPTRAGGYRMVFWRRDGTDATLPSPVVGSSWVD